MGSIIYMNTEEVTHLISQIRQIKQNMSEQVNKTMMLTSNLDWTGPDRDHFVGSIQSWKQVCSNQLADLQNLSDQLAAERNQWIEADRSGANHVKSIIADASVGSSISGVLAWLNNLFRQKEQQYTIDEAWEQMMSTKSGKELIELSKKYGIKFILPSGKIIGDGDYVVNITVEDLEEGTLGDASPGSIRFDQEFMDEKYETPDYLAQVLAHEIQHQVDQEQGLLPEENHAEIIMEYLINDDYDSAEKMLKEAIQKRTESEVRAFNRGFEVDSGDQDFEKMLNDDGVYSQEEVEFVIETMGYESIYEEQYNNKFLGHRVDVWVDDAGQIQCEIRRLIEARDVYYA